MANPDIGTMPCRSRECTDTATVRRASTGQCLLYLQCPTCGPLFYRTRAGQDFILKNATLYGPGGAPEPDEVADVPPPPVPVPPAPVPPPPPKPERQPRAWFNPLEF